MVFLLAVILLITPVFANPPAPDTFICYGEDLTKEQLQWVMDQFHPGGEVEYVTVSNAEEYQYLGDVIPANKIGSKALSSAMLELVGSGEGITVVVDEHIRYITPGIYRNALVTAGISDAKVSVVCPVNVSGTAALTGIMKAYERYSGEEISKERKKVANEEMVVTAKLGETVGEKETNDLINSLKVQIAQKKPKTPEETRTLILNVTNEIGITLTEEQVNQLTDLFVKMQNTDIDWKKIEENAKKYSDKAKEYSEKFKEYLDSEEGQKMAEKSKNLIVRFLNWLISLFQ